MEETWCLQVWKDGNGNDGMVREREVGSGALFAPLPSLLTWNGRLVSFATMAAAPRLCWPSKVRMDSF